MIPALATAFDALEARRQALFADLAARPPASLDARPAPTAWSLAEVAQHLWLVERGTVHVMEGRLAKPPLRRGPLNRLGIAAMRFVLGRIRFKVPIAAIQPKPGVPLSQVRADWDATRAKLRAMLEGIDETRLHQSFFRHPLAGALSVAETMEFLVRHHDHHLRQVARIDRLMGASATGYATGGVRGEG